MRKFALIVLAAASLAVSACVGGLAAGAAGEIVDAAVNAAQPGPGLAEAAEFLADDVPQMLDKADTAIGAAGLAVDLGERLRVIRPESARSMRYRLEEGRQLVSQARGFIDSGQPQRAAQLITRIRNVARAVQREAGGRHTD